MAEQLDQVVAALKRGKGLGPVVASYPAGDLGTVDDLLDIGKPKVRAAVCEAHRELVTRSVDHAGLLAPLAVALALAKHRVRRTVFGKVVAAGATVSQRTHALAMTVEKPATSEVVLELCELLVATPGMDPAVYHDTLSLLVDRKGGLRRTNKRVREILELCRRYGSADPRTERIALEIEELL